MKLSNFWKSQQFWWVPILVLLLGALGWIIKYRLEQSKKPGAIIGNVINISAEATVRLEDSEYGVKTAKVPNGFFRFDGIPSGKHQIEINHPGYRTIFEYINVYGGRDNEIVASFPENNIYRHQEISELLKAMRKRNTIFHPYEIISDTSDFNLKYAISHYVAQEPEGYTTINKQDLLQDIDSIVLKSSETLSLYLYQYSIKEIDTIHFGRSELYFHYFVEGIDIGTSKPIIQDTRRNSVQNFTGKGLFLNDIRLPIDYDFNLKIELYIRNKEINNDYRDDLIGRFLLTFQQEFINTKIGPIPSVEIPYYDSRNSTLTFLIK
nr:carboxypeptidase-like regulatory domain-containing protein [uncultured Psychroserpens sp.]